MSSAFRGTQTASAQADPAQPTVFDMLAQQSQTQSLKPAIQYLLKFGTFFYKSKNYQTLLRYFDEIYMVGMMAVEGHFLKKYGASFSENFYSMRRQFETSSGSTLTPFERRKSLFFLVILPYIETKLSDYRNKIENTDPFMKLLGLVSLIFLVVYGFGYIKTQSLALYLVGAKLRRLTVQETEEFEKPVYNESGALGRLTRLFLQVPSWTGRFFSYALFFKDVHEYMQANSDDESKTFRYEGDFARPTHPIHMISDSQLSQLEVDKCPICHNKRENDTVLSVSGYVFCFSCINAFVRTHKRCPVTNLPATHEHLVRLYRKSG